MKKEMKAKISFDPFTIQDFDVIIYVSVPLSFAVNSINSAMGIPDVYALVNLFLDTLFQWYSYNLSPLCFQSLRCLRTKIILNSDVPQT